MRELLLRSMVALMTLSRTDRTLPPEVYSRLEVRADVILSAFSAPWSPEDTEDAASLMVIDFYETTYGQGGVPFGACAHLCRHHCGQCREAPLSEIVPWSLSVLRTARAHCGGPLYVRLAYYHGGTCSRNDRFAHFEAARVRYALNAWSTVPIHATRGTLNL